MTGQQIIDLLQYRCGNRSDLATVAFLELVLAQEELEGGSIKPWFLLRDYTDVAFITVADQEYIDEPTDFLGFDDDQGGLWWQDTASTDADQWQYIPSDYYADSAALAQRADFGWKVDWLYNRFYFRPIPTEAKTLRLIGFFKQAAPTLVTENLWCKWAADVLLAKVGERLANLHLQDNNLGKQFTQDLQRGLTRLHTENISRKMTGRSLSIGLR